MKSKNSNGPSTVPWDTPLTTGILSEVASSTRTSWVLSVRKARIHHGCSSYALMLVIICWILQQRLVRETGQ